MREVNLLRGNIFSALLKMALPLMGTAFVQMAYSLVDLMWLGRLSTEAVAAVGALLPRQEFLLDCLRPLEEMMMSPQKKFG